MDPASLVEVVNSRCDYELTLVGEAEQGETSGAVYVRWPDGREGVITRTNKPLERMRQTADVVESLRRRGLPVPRQEPIPLDDVYWTVLNVLFDNTGEISAIVDWNGGVARGDRCFALVGLRADLTLGAWMQANHPQVLQEAIDRLDDYLTSVLDPTLMRRYWAHCTVHRLHWTITFNDAEAIDMALRLGNLYLR